MDVENTSRTLEDFEAKLRLVDGAQWQAATPCGEWDVRALVNHMVNELLWIPPLLEGKTIAEVGDRFDGDILGTDPLAAAASAGKAVLAAASEPGALERIAHLSFGDVPGGEYLGHVTADLVIHTWDLSKGIGADDRMAADLLAFAEEVLGPLIESWRSAGAFGPAVELPEGAGPQDRLLAQTGRSPNWTV
jgi:uncharacterized protein (TIGR03086 family)